VACVVVAGGGVLCKDDCESAVAEGSDVFESKIDEVEGAFADKVAGDVWHGAVALDEAKFIPREAGTFLWRPGHFVRG
jgi:hypothetical protein